MAVTKTVTGGKKREEHYSQRTQISLSKRQREKIRALQTALGVSMSEVVRRATGLLASSLGKDKDVTKSVLRKTAGQWRGRKFSGLEYERKIRKEEEKRLKGIGIG